MLDFPLTRSYKLSHLLPHGSFVGFTLAFTLYSYRTCHIFSHFLLILYIHCITVLATLSLYLDHNQRYRVPLLYLVRKPARKVK